MTEFVENEKEDEGATIVEYLILMALIVVVSVLAIEFLGTQISSRYSLVASSPV